MVVLLFYSVKKEYYLEYYEQNDLASYLESRNIFLESELVFKTPNKTPKCEAQLFYLAIYALFNKNKRRTIRTKQSCLVRVKTPFFLCTRQNYLLIPQGFVKKNDTYIGEKE